MKKKSGHRRRTKVVRKSRKNLRRTIKRKSLGKGRRRPTRRYSRIQRGGVYREGVDREYKRDEQFLERGIQHEWLGDNDATISRAQSYMSARNMYRKAIEQSDDRKTMQARYRLGVMYEDGKGVAPDDAEAMRYYQLVADSRNEGVMSKFEDDPCTKVQADARYKLGKMYEDGKGVAQNLAQAMYWYRLAASEGHKEAKKRLKIAPSDSITPSQSIQPP
jgi:hypothetical protein